MKIHICICGEIYDCTNANRIRFIIFNNYRKKKIGHDYIYLDHHQEISKIHDIAK